MASYPALDVRFAPGPGAGALQDLLYAELDAFEPLAIQEHEAGDGWLVFFRLPAQRNGAREALASALGRNVVELQPVEVEDEDWARRTQANLTAIRAGRIVVAPPWDTPAPGASDAHVIVIEPSMGFGTGHHATTRMCLELLQQIDVSGRRMIDVGTGSGVLAIAARLLGASDVTAIDNDPDALLNARDNIALNAGAAGIDVLEADLSTLTLQSAAIVTANLTGAVLQKYSGELLRLLAPGGALIVSGFSPAESAGVLKAFGMNASRQLVEGEWCAALMNDKQ